jgi:uncharacterized protein (TIGR02466 family)
MVEKLYIRLINFLFKFECYKLLNLTNILVSKYSNKYKKYYYIYKFYKRNKKKYEQTFLENIYPPKIFLIKNIPFDEIIFDNIKKYKKINPKNEFDNRGHKNIYQSQHNLNEQEEYKFISELIVNIINRKIIPKYKLNNTEARLNKLWFTITKKSGFMKRHHHLDGEISGVLYLKCGTGENAGLINFYNTERDLIFYTYDHNINIFKKELIKSKIFTHKPLPGDLVIFDSYIEHSVNNAQDIETERISMPWDASLDIKV